MHVRKVLKMSFINGIYNISAKIYKLMLLNFFWVLFVLRGLVIFGLYPATAALFSVLRQLDKNNDEKLYPLFKKYFHQEFKLSNAIGLPSLILVYVLLVSYRYLSAGIILAHPTAQYAILLALLAIIVHTTYLFPIISHYNFQKNRDYVKLPLLFGLGYIGHTIVIFCLMALSYYTFLQWSILIPFIGVSVNCYIVFKLTNNLLKKHPI